MVILRENQKELNTNSCLALPDMSTLKTKALKPSKQSCPNSVMSESVEPVASDDISLSSEISHASVSTIRKRKKRGRTRNLKLILLAPGEKKQIEFNEYSQAIGPNASIFANHLGCLVRNCENCPIDAESWDMIPEENKEKLYHLILDKFEFQLTEPIKFWISQKMRKQFSISKSRLKARYCDCFESLEAMIQNRPRHVPEDQWRGFVRLIHTTEFKIRSKRNKTNREKQKMAKTTGTKSFACFRRDLSKELGYSPGKYEFWKRTRIRKDKKTMIDSVSQNIVDQVEKSKGKTSSSSDSTTPVDEGEDDIFSRVIGPERHGRVRCYGVGPTPTVVFGGAPTRSELRGKLDEANKRNAELQLKLNGIEQQLETTVNHLEEERRKNEEERRRSEEERKKSEEERSKIF